MGRSYSVFVVVDNSKVEHRDTVIEAIGMIRGIKVSMLFDSRATDSFISPFIVGHCGLVATRKNDNWEVELASRAEVIVNSYIHDC